MPAETPKRLSAIERRIVGTLLEKMLATPQSYPLTLNSLTTGCNQKSNRDPEMTLVDAEVMRALEGLLEKGLVVVQRVEGARVEKWKGRGHEAFGLASEKSMALMAELLVRGPQTLSELRRNSSRMRHELTDEDVRQILADLGGRETPLVVNLGRAPGGRTERWSHTLFDEEEMRAQRAGSVPPMLAGTAGLGGPSYAAPVAQALPSAAPSPVASSATPPAAPSEETAALAEKLAAALEEIQALARRVRVLEARVEVLEGAGGGSDAG